MKKTMMCHNQVAAVAKQAACEMYEVVMRDNLVRETWKKKHPGMREKGLIACFVQMYWPKCIPFARATMARMLTDNTIDAALKDTIMEALEMDSTLVLGRVNLQQAAQELMGGNPIVTQ